MKRIIVVVAIVLGVLLGIPPNINAEASKTSSKQYKVTNIVLFGLDRLNDKTNGRSDSIMVLTIDYTHKKLKLTSFMRDLYVHIDNHGFTKLNSAYAYGGYKLAIKTLNQNFGLDIKDYCTVDFFTLEKIINKVGGVRINVKGNEIQYINSYVSQVSKIKHKKITKSGIQLLDGAQAVAYSRIRYTGRGDFDRTERQRTVLMTLINDANKRGDNAVIDLVLKFKPYVKTNMNNARVISIGADYLNLLPLKAEQARFPVDGYWKDYISKGVDYLKVDLKLCKQQVMNYIFKDIKPVPKK